jgi:hypothetical protein
VTAKSKPKTTGGNGGKFQAGNPGRPKGTPNKVNQEFRETVRMLLETNAQNVGRWLALVAEGDGSEHGKPDPAKALDLLSKLAEFAAPKLGRVEHVGEGGGPVRFTLDEKDAKA